VIKIKGYPKYLNTKEDYKYIKNYFPSEQWKVSYKILLDDSQKWFREEQLENENDGVNNAISMVRSEREEENGEEKTKYYQYRFRIDPNCKLLRLGMKIEDIKNALKE